MNIIRHEEWKAIVNDTSYTFDEKEAAVLNEAISSNSRGIVQFSTCIISIPYLQEFYLVRHWEEVVYSDEEIEQSRQKQLKANAEWEAGREERERKEREAQELVDKAREELAKKMEADKPKKMTRKQFEDRRKELLEQAKSL